jgi:hypothetical protein
LLGGGGATLGRVGAAAVDGGGEGAVSSRAPTPNARAMRPRLAMTARRVVMPCGADGWQ